MDAWASTVLSAVTELSDRADLQRATVTSASMAIHSNSASKEALVGRISDLQALIHEHEKKERQLQAKLLDVGKCNTMNFSYCQDVI